MDYLPHIAAVHVDEDVLPFEQMSDVLAGRGVQLAINQIGDMPASAIKQVIHTRIPYVPNLSTSNRYGYRPKKGHAPK
jgi:hypothetical protein